MSPPPARSGGGAWVVALAGGLVPLAFYAAGLHPGLPAGDSGELIAVAATGGVAHPPGYPLYTLLAGIWLHVFALGSEAWRLNVFSAVCAAAAAGVLAVAVRRASGVGLAGVLAAWSWAFAAQPFTWSLVAEVFALNALLAACVLLALVSTPAAGSVALALLTGLAVAHHHTLLLLVVPALVVSALRALRAATPRRPHVLRMLGAGLCGLLPLLWLPLAAQRTSAQVWGDASSLGGFVSLLSRAEYGTLRLDPAQSGLAPDAAHLLAFARALPSGFGVFPLVLALVGLGVVARVCGRGALAAVAAFLVLQAWFFTRIGFPAGDPTYRGVVERFYVLPLVVLAFQAGIATGWLAARVGRTRMGRVAIAGAFLVPVLVPAPLELARRSERGNQFTETLGRALLASLPLDAVLFARGDVPHNALAYLTQVREQRADVTVVDQELMSDPWYVRRVRARWPQLLPPLGRAERIRFSDGHQLEGLTVNRADGSVDVLAERGQFTLPRSSVTSATPARAESLFAATRANFRHAPFLEQGEDRYSGLPGTRTLLWFDHLAGQRPVAVMGTKDDSWALHYVLVPVGMVEIAYPRGGAPPATEQLAAALVVADSADPNVYYGRYAPGSLERAEAWRFSELVGRTALLLCLPDAAPVIARHPGGYARVLAFARRFETLVPSPDPEALAAIGYLRWVDPGFRDVGQARRDLERALAERPRLADAERARRVLSALRDNVR